MLKNLNRFKYVIIFAVILLALLPGALSAQDDITQRVLVTAAGADAGTNGGVRLSVQFFAPQGAQASPETADTAEAEGANAAEAAERVGIKAGRFADMSFCNTVLIGEDTARGGGAVDILSFFLRGGAGGNAYAAVCAGTARNAVGKLIKTDRAASSDMGGMLRRNDKRGLSAAVSIKDFLERAKETGCAYLPFVEFAGRGASEGGGSDGGASAEVADSGKTAVFKDGGLIRILDAEDTRAVSAFGGGASEGVETLNGVNFPGMENVPVSLNINSEKRRLKYSFEGGAPVLTVSVSVRATPAAGSGGANFTESERRDFAAAVEKRLAETAETRAARIREIIVSERCDFLGVTSAFSRLRPFSYKKFAAANPGAYLPELLRIRVELRAEIIT